MEDLKEDTIVLDNYDVEVSTGVVTNKYNLEPGDECLVWGKKGSVENAKVRYFSYVVDDVYYFNNDKTDAYNSRKEFTRQMFGGHGQAWTNFKRT